MIHIDSREKSEIPAMLKRYEVPTKTVTLEVGDYAIIGPTISACVESKSAGDYVSSIRSGVLNDELLQLSSGYTYGILLVHGDISDALLHRKMQRSTWFEYLAGCAVGIAPTGKQGRISVITVDRVSDAVFFLRTLYKKIIQDSIIREPLATKAKAPKGLEQIYTLKWLFPPECHIGPTRSKALLKKFKSIKNVINATKEEIEALDGFGEIIAESMIKHLERRFK